MEDGLLFVVFELDCSGPDDSAESVAEMMGVSLMADCGSSAIGLRPKPEALVGPLLEIEIVMFPGTPSLSCPVNLNCVLHTVMMVVV